MKILAVHADFIEFAAKKKAFKGAEEGVEKGQQEKVEECLVIFTAVEKRDEDDLLAVKEKYIREIKNISQQVNAQNIVLYPYAHLSSNLASPKIAEQFMKDAQVELSQKYKVSRAPFGWYKSFNISCKGHPLSELSREFGPESNEVKKEDKEKEVQSNKIQINVSESVENKLEGITNLKKEFKDEPFEFNSRELTEDEKLKLTAAYSLAGILKQQNSNLQVGSAGFYHDQVYVDVTVKVDNNSLKSLEKKVKNQQIKKITNEQDSNLDDLQQDIAKDLNQQSKTIVINGLSVVPLFINPLSEMKILACKILNLSSVYWKNNQNNQQLTRIHLVAFDSEEKLTQYLKKQEEVEARSHLKIGKEQGLFVNSNLVGPGLPLIAPKGMIVRQEIVNFLWDLHKLKGYEQVWTPHIAKEDLYKKSGHWDKFGDELFKVQGKSDKFIIKPMNCPHHMQIFDNFTFSYRDMPVRYFEPATVYRDEKSGQLNGLSRVRAITQDDGHIFCRVNQIKEEVALMVDVIKQFYETIGMVKNYWVSLSVRGNDQSKYLGSNEVWVLAEESLENAAKENNLPYRRIVGEAAFYGPKLDFMFKDALGREWQLATIQCDFNLPERFDLSFMNEEIKKERPVVIHRAISGSLERFMSILIEHFAGKFPLWLNPVQVKIVTINDGHLEFAKKVVDQMKEVNLRVELDDRVESMGKKIRDAQMEKVNYIVTIGDKEIENNSLAVRTRSGETKFGIPISQFISELIKEVKERKL